MPSTTSESKPRIKGHNINIAEFLEEDMYKRLEYLESSSTDSSSVPKSVTEMLRDPPIKFLSLFMLLMLSGWFILDILREARIALTTILIVSLCYLIFIILTFLVLSYFFVRLKKEQRADWVAESARSSENIIEFYNEVEARKERLFLAALELSQVHQSPEELAGKGNSLAEYHFFVDRLHYTFFKPSNHNGRLPHEN